MTNNPSNLGTNPQFSVLDFARNNSPRGNVLSTKANWDTTLSVPLTLQPPTNTSNGEMFFVKEINLLVKKGTGFGNNKFQIYHNAMLPSVIIEATSTIELFSFFDIHPASPIQDPEAPTDPDQQWDKLLIEFPTPIKIRSSNAESFQIRVVNSVDVIKADGLVTGEIQVSVLGWRILEATY